MLALIVFSCLMTSPASPGDRLYVVLHNPHTDESRWNRELSLVRELGFGGVRISFAMPDMLNKDGLMVSNYGRRWVDYALKRIKDAGLKLHITLSDNSADASPAANLAAHRYLVTKAAELFPPNRLTFDLQNEPKAFIHLDSALVEALNRHYEAMRGLWEDTGLKARGYALMSPTFHGFHSEWVDGRSLPDLKLADSLKRYSTRLANVYGSSMGSWLKGLSPALNLYAPGRNEDAAEFEFAMAQMVRKFMKDNKVPMPMAINEFGVFFGSGISDEVWAPKVAAMAKVLMRMPEIRFATYYCLSNDDRYELITSEGDRNERKIAALKSSLVKVGLSR